MASICLPIAQEDVPAFKNVLATHDLVDLLEEKAPSHDNGPVLFTLDAGLGNAIHYYYLGLVWSATLLQKGGKPHA